MLRRFIKKNKLVTENAIKQNLLKVSADETKIECVDSPEAANLLLILNDEDSDIRKYAQLNFALALLNNNHPTPDKEPIQPIESLRKHIADNDRGVRHNFDLAFNFNLVLIEKNRALLKIIFKWMVIKVFHFKSFDFSIWSNENFDVLADMLAVAKIEVLAWNPFLVPLTLGEERVRHLQGKIPSIHFYGSPIVPDRDCYLSAFEILVNIPTVQSISFESHFRLSAFFGEIISILNRSSISNIRFASFGLFTTSREAQSHLSVTHMYTLHEDDLVIVCRYIQSKVKTLDLSANDAIWNTPSPKVINHYMSRREIARQINLAIAGSQIKSLCLNSSMFDNNLDLLSLEGLCDALQKCKTLSELSLKFRTEYENLSEEKFSVFLEAICQLPLSSLYMNGGPVAAMNSRQVATIFRNLKLEELTCGHVDWSKENWLTLFEELKAAPLKRLCIPFFANIDEDDEMYDAQAVKLAKSLWSSFCGAIRFSKLVRITILDSSSGLLNIMTEEMVDQLVDAITINSNVTEIVVDDCSWKDNAKFIKIHNALMLNRELAECLKALNDFSFQNKDQAALEAAIIDVTEKILLHCDKRKEKPNASDRYMELLQPAIVDFLPKLQSESGRQTSKLLRLLPANTDEVKRIYYTYAYYVYQSILPVNEDKHRDKLFKMTKYCFDARDEYIQFKDGDNFIDLMLFKALNFTHRPSLTPAWRLALWQYLTLQDYKREGIDDLNGINILMPLSEQIILRINAAWKQRWIVSADNVACSKSFKYGLRYTKELYKWQQKENELTSILEQKNFSSFYSDFIRLLPDYLNGYSQLVTLSSQHQALFDKALMRACGDRVKTIENDADRLMCAEFILIAMWEKQQNVVAPRAAAFYQLPHKEYVSQVKRRITLSPLSESRKIMCYIESLSQQIAEQQNALNQRIALSRLGSHASTSSCK